MPFHRPISSTPQRSRFSSGVGTLVEAEKLLQIALMLPSAVVIGWLLGAWADHHFQQSWCSIAGVVLGAIAGLTYVIRMAFSAMAASGKPSGPSGSQTSGPQNGTPGSHS